MHRVSMILAIFVLVRSTCGSAIADEPQAAVNNELITARKLAFVVAGTVIEKIRAGDLDRYPGAKAWLADFQRGRLSSMPRWERRNGRISSPMKW